MLYREIIRIYSENMKYETHRPKYIGGQNAEFFLNVKASGKYSVLHG
jgi:hypothetical protein